LFSAAVRLDQISRRFVNEDHAAKMTHAIKLEDVWKSFGAVQAVQGVNAEFSYGEITGLVGDNAAGKSTLIKMLSGIHRPDRGTIYIEGKQVDIREPLDARKLGIETIYQDLALSPFLDVSSNIFLGREITSSWGILNKKEMRLKSKDILEHLGFGFDDAMLGREVSYFSGGQQQAVAVARSFFFGPKILLLDEPTASIGVKGVEILHKFIKEFKKEEKCMIYITHRLPDVFAVSDRIMVMRTGKIVDVRKTEDTTLERTIRIMIGAE
jgi:simple sugar transport system ATP-binding protein